MQEYPFPQQSFPAYPRDPKQFPLHRDYIMSKLGMQII